MGINNSGIIDVEYNGRNVKEIKKITYRGLEIYAVKRSKDYSNPEYALLEMINKAWWCGYVEVPLDMYGLLKPRGYLDEEILYRLADPGSCNLEVVHGGYTYVDYGIPLVLDGDQRIFIGWDYNHFCDTEDCVAYKDVIDEGKRVVDSMLDNRIEKEKRK